MVITSRLAAVAVLSFAVLSGSAIAQPPPPPLHSLWVHAGGAIGETAELGVASHIAGLDQWVLGFSHSVHATAQFPQIAPPVYLLAIGRFPGAMSTVVRVPVPNAPSLVGLAGHLQAGFSDGQVWLGSRVLTWLIAPLLTRRFVLASSVCPFPMGAGDGHARVTLGDGTVLLTGGRDPSLPARFRNLAWIYDPAKASAWAIASMNTARGGHVLRVLADGTVLVVGGDQDVHNPTAELYDPNTQRFVSLGAVPAFLQDPTATVVREPGTGGEFVLVAGGFAARDTGPAAAAMLYNAVRRTFSRLPDMARPRLHAAAVALAGGSVLLTGGKDALLAAGADAELFLLATRSFRAWGAMNAPRYGHAMVALDSARALVISGGDGTGARRDVELFDGPAQRAWTLPVSLYLGRVRFDPVVLADGSILVAGGGESGPTFPDRTPEVLSAAGATLLRPIGAMQPAVAIQPLAGGGAMAFDCSSVHHLR